MVGFDGEALDTACTDVPSDKILDIIALRDSTRIYVYVPFPVQIKRIPWARARARLVGIRFGCGF